MFEQKDPEDVIDQILQYQRDDPSAYSLMVPNDCLAIVIGKNCETLKMLINMSGVDQIKIANEGMAGQTDRKIFIYGSQLHFERVKKMI